MISAPKAKWFRNGKSLLKKEIWILKEMHAFMLLDLVTVSLVWDRIDGTSKNCDEAWYGTRGVGFSLSMNFLGQLFAPRNDERGEWSPGQRPDQGSGSRQASR